MPRRTGGYGVGRAPPYPQGEARRGGTLAQSLFGEAIRRLGGGARMRSASKEHYLFFLRRSTVPRWKWEFTRMRF